MKNDINTMLQTIRRHSEQAAYWRTRGDDRLAEYHRQQADALKRKARQRGVILESHGIEPPVPYWKMGKAAQARKKEPRKNVNMSAVMAGVFMGVQNVTGSNYALQAIQQATTEAECYQWLEVIRSMYTDQEGKLDKKGYCEALNESRANMQVTIEELQRSIREARRSGDSGVIAGYEKLIERYKANIDILEKEIRKNGGQLE